MAKAEAECTCKVCGEIFYKTSCQPNRKSAASWEEWAAGYFTICPECEQKAREDKAAEYAKEASEDGLPELVGTEKQVVWAEQIRHEKISYFSECIQKEIEKGNGKMAADAEMTMSYILSTKNQSRWWIDNRDYDARRILDIYHRKAQEAEMAKQKSRAPESDNTVVVPENAEYGVAEIVIADDRVETYYPWDEKFREIVKAAGCFWNEECWVKKISYTTGTAIDRAADIANRLLRAGFSIKCKYPEVREKAVSGDFEPECIRWLLLYREEKYKGWLAIRIFKKDADSQELYDAARAIKGSKWSKGAVVVPVARYKMVEDFCDIYGFKISPAAADAIEKYKAAHTIMPQKPAEAEEKRDVLGDILGSSREVLPDLMDD